MMQAFMMMFNCRHGWGDERALRWRQPVCFGDL